ncbi:Cof-type HAD-IIB family hydrolase [Crassaminicella indica]|uniref:Cof-type HAD-IIB family hydrolase n=1 Tax=Crassaminicella indica TaxID=2855394 RepID=A0ABX8RD98_9CLOT|nr:Cof-type HAD-IIB family hydrolase [Crassaminicella indica]QXM05695.1 Cof-type HAD-IIB family hydrolase [Crassaminicella indica]
MYKLVVSDMDGTLLNSENEVSEGNKRAFKDLLDNDIHVAIATGRIYTSARVYAKHLGIVTPVIACNGAIVRNLKNDEIIYESHIDKEDCLKVLEVAKKYDVYFHFYTANTFYTERLAHSSLKYSEWNKTLKEEDRIDIRIIDNAYKHIERSKENIYKIQMISDDQALLSNVRKELEALGTIEICKSWHNNIEIMNKGVSKGNALHQLAQSLGIKREEIISFGDNENDISMLTYAGLGVAMGNAEEFVKSSADYVTDTNDKDGVAKALRKFVL